LTIVAAWMRAETGVGPSIASGSQTWSGNWALLPIAPAKIRRAISPTGIGKATRVSLVRTWIESWMLSVPVSTQMAMIPRAKPTSPTRLTRNAFLLARAAEFLRYQKPMRRYEQRPTSSQATKTVSQLSARTSRSIENMNRLR